MKKILIGGSLSLFALALSFNVAFAADITIGNDASARSIVDTYQNFVIVDTNHPANADGVINSIDYYAKNTNTFRFLLVDKDKKVKWVSEEITPTASAVNTLSLAIPVKVAAEDNIGMYFKQSGTIPFSYTETTGNVYWQGNGTGLPSVGQTLNVETITSEQHREYSFIAHGKTTFPSNKDECKKGGWNDFGIFKNQGDCVSFIATKGKNLPAKNLIGQWLLNVNGGAYMHDMFIDTQSPDGLITGHGGYPAGQGPTYPHPYNWTMTGNLIGNIVTMTITYQNGYTATISGPVNSSFDSMSGGTGTGGVSSWSASKI